MRNLDLKGRNFILSVSGGNVMTSLGGTEKVIITHQKMFNSKDTAYVYIYPVHKAVHGCSLYYFWGVIYDGRFMGLYSSDELLAALNSSINHECALYKIHIHHLRGIDLKQLSILLDYFKKTDIFLYLHDYYVICENYTLVASDDYFCGEGLPCKNKCKNCTYLAMKEKSELRREFISGYLSRITMIAPSDYPSDVVAHTIPAFADKIRVLYHQKWVGAYKDNCEKLNDASVVKIAYCGLPVPVKGWRDWVVLTNEISMDDKQIQFYHLGKASDTPGNYQNVPVGFQDDCMTMTEALRSYKINVALLWSQFPETYSYVYYECLAANCFIITYKDSGNVAKQVQSNGTGVVLNSLEELQELLSDHDKLIRLINAVYKKKIFGPNKLVENGDIVNLSVNSMAPIVIYKKECRKNLFEYVIEKTYRMNLKNKWKVDL